MCVWLREDKSEIMSNGATQTAPNPHPVILVKQQSVSLPSSVSVVCRKLNDLPRFYEQLDIVDTSRTSELTQVGPFLQAAAVPFVSTAQ